METFDIYERRRGYLLDVQSDLLDGLNTVLTVPLMPPEEAPRPARKLNPVFEIGGQPYVMVTQFMAATPIKTLGRPAGSIKFRYYDEIKAALDMIFLGF